MPRTQACDYRRARPNSITPNNKNSSPESGVRSPESNPRFQQLGRSARTTTISYVPSRNVYENKRAVTSDE